MQYSIAQWRQQQRIQHRINLRQHVAISPARPTPIVAAREIVGIDYGHCVRHVEINHALIEIVAGQVIRLPV
jgi:hypothetical protein